MLEHARRVLTALARYPARWLVRHHVGPNTVTAVGTILLCAVALATIPWGWLTVAAPLMALVALTDGLDGQMARLTQTTKFGALLDSTLDRVSDGVVGACLIVWFARRPDGHGVVWSGVPLDFVDTTRTVWIAVALVALVTGQAIPYARARADSLGLDGTGGITGRADRLAITCIAVFCAGLGIPYSLEAGVAIMALLGIITVVQRLGKAYRTANA
ncbi:MAG: CDP-alcohol phosphatidyltransferase family protein [Propionibacteriaceae bacterium]|jgi:CDP-diacylglycerol--glycerol-3-phosphate 3-phosphatidyltransferase|nr:CDP-alcohol phosphatidyltransferase family protein [Propionibacteriaceae bacterium]